MNRAVIYARFSNGPRQTEQSIEGQITECRRFAEANNLFVVDVYADKHISGKSTEGRFEFLRMVEDAKKGLFDAVIVWKVDRFGRDRRDIAVYKHALKQAGVSLYYAAESVPEGPEGIILESVLEGLAEYYSADLRQKVERGMRESIKKGQYPGKLPIGYKKDSDKRVILDQEKAELVREIFRLHCGGHNTTEIVHILANKGTETSKGSIYRILNNKAYTGKLEILGETIDVEPIITSEEWEESNQHFQTSRNRKGKTSFIYLLSGKCTCGKCQGNVIGRSGRGKAGTVYGYYQCASKCFKPVRAEKLEDKVLQNVTANLLTNDTIKTVVDRIMEIQEEEQNNNAALESLQAKISAVRKKRENLLSAVENGLYSPDMNDRISRLLNEESELAELIAKEEIKKPIIPREYLEQWMRRFRNGDILDEEFCQKLIRTFVEEVILFEDHAIVVCNATEKSGEPCSFALSLVNLTKLCSNSNSPFIELPYIYLYVPI